MSTSAWVIFKLTATNLDNVPDLLKDNRVAGQHRSV